MTVEPYTTVYTYAPYDSSNFFPASDPFWTLTCHISKICLVYFATKNRLIYDAIHSKCDNTIHREKTILTTVCMRHTFPCLQIVTCATVPRKKQTIKTL